MTEGPAVLFAAVIASRRLIAASGPGLPTSAEMLLVSPSETSAVVVTVMLVTGVADTGTGRSEPDTAASTSAEPTAAATARLRRGPARRRRHIAPGRHAPRSPHA